MTNLCGCVLRFLIKFEVVVPVSFIVFPHSLHVADLPEVLSDTLENANDKTYGTGSMSKPGGTLFSKRRCKGEPLVPKPVFFAQMGLVNLATWVVL